MGGAVVYVSVVGLQYAWNGGLAVGVWLAVNDDGITVQLLITCSLYAYKK